jgi:polar amino acid transport system substrate-binding protein
MKRFKIFKLLMIFFVLSQTSVFADTITVACSQWKPHYYQEKGIIKGTGYEIAKAVMEQAKVVAEFQVQPWKRVYITGLNKANYMISCLGRTPEREPFFHWVGPVAKSIHYNFYKLKKSKFIVKSHRDILQYRVGVMRGSLTQNFMENMSHEDIHGVSRAEQLIKLLKVGRVDLILEATNVIEHESKTANIDPDIFEMATVGYELSINMAVGKKTPLSVVQAIQKAYKSLEMDGKIIFP